MFHFKHAVQHTLKKIIIIALTLLTAWGSFAYATTTSHTKTTHHKQHTVKHSKKKTHPKHKHSIKSKANVRQNTAVPTQVNHPAITEDHVQEPDVTESPVTATATTTKTSLVATLEERLIGFVHKTVDTLHYSRYKMGGTNVDTERGVYVVDCSTYVDYILKTIYPHAYFNLIDATGADKPTTQHYYDFFTELSEGPNHYWDRIDEVEQLRPGDILVFRNKSRIRSGHVMVVMNTPIRDADSFLVRVADSAPVGHSHDTRPSHVSGIGIGTLLLKVDSDGQPFAYAWKVGSQWKRNVNFAMARPIGIR